jgi:hypothetical protein
MSINPGLTADEIRQFVHEYYVLPQGQKAAWLREQGVSRDRFRRWSSSVFEGDLDRGLIPREGSVMTISRGERSALERIRAAERIQHETDIAKLNARIRELEDVSAALGKAIGLLHSRNEQEPSTPQNPASPSPS